MKLPTRRLIWSERRPTWYCARSPPSSSRESPRRGRYAVSFWRQRATLCILYRESLVEYTGDGGRVTLTSRARESPVITSASRTAASASASVTWGDNAVSRCRSYSRGKGPGTSAGPFLNTKRHFPCPERTQGVPRGPGTPRIPRVSSPAGDPEAGVGRLGRRLAEHPAQPQHLVAVHA
jgi:hypothetical protein